MMSPTISAGQTLENGCRSLSRTITVKWIAIRRAQEKQKEKIDIDTFVQRIC